MDEIDYDHQKGGESSKPKYTLKFTQEDNKAGALLEESSFTILFPSYREKYLQKNFPMIAGMFKTTWGIKCTLSLVDGTMTVKTTRKTWDPFSIIKARDLLTLLSRSVPFQQASRVMEDGQECDIIRIKGLVKNKSRFVKRRARLIGPDGGTLRALELLTGCFILVQGNTVAVVGSPSGLETVRQVVTDCMNNIHPVYHIKALMIKRELSKLPEMESEDWSRFLPAFKAKNVKSRKPHKQRTTSTYTPFPPTQTERAEDKKYRSGEAFVGLAKGKLRRGKDDGKQ
eukprot:gnl/Dysnectes_brevis/875_a970_2572.p1 GENE.gnl/Dysnectes_brevis/875_a970_2572~~gnl/Dysnectes_brevis/875_a970_2572.p1  ORF type:complete len:285 (+),score=89.29 gnl/Dysnectes_brevis/875_a970_2572:34-888(+)